VIPRAAEEEVFRRALEKVQKENLVGRAIEDGMSAQEAFKKFGKVPNTEAAEPGSVMWHCRTSW
jgi:hypothetical protein